MGLKQAGFEVLGAVEIDELAVETYRLNHPEVTVWHEDIRRLAAKDVKLGIGLGNRKLDLLAGCPPCQGFSAMRTLNRGKRVRDPRNALLSEFVRFVRVLKPRVVMLENVPGLQNTVRMSRLVRSLRKLGYHVKVAVFDAAEFNVPQRRRRVILLASEQGEVAFARPARTSSTVRQAIGSLPPHRRSRDPLHDLPESRSEDVRELIRHIPRNGGSRRDAGEEYLLACHKACDGFYDVYGRMAWGDVAPTITTGCVNPSKGRFLHPERHRCITLREAALLQTFPKRYEFPLRKGKFAVAEMIGNALPPEFVRRHALAVYRHLDSATWRRGIRAHD